jgi:hypothetical protein
LSQVVTRVCASAAVAAVCEIRGSVFLFKIILENVERGLAWVVLADPEISIRLDVKEKLARAASPVENLRTVVLLAGPAIELRSEEGR